MLLLFWLILELLLDVTVLLELDCTRDWVRLVEFRFTCARLVLLELLLLTELVFLVGLLLVLTLAPVLIVLVLIVLIF